MRRYPQLRAARALHILLRQQSLSDEALRNWKLPDLSREQFAPTGPAKVTEAELLGLRKSLIEAAQSAGYPNAGEEQKRTFDKSVTRLLGEQALPLNETLRPETWTWVAVHVVPELVRWRWAGNDGSVSQARYCGIIQRNALGRLWYRAYVLDLGAAHADRWMLADAVTEDAAMNILERTTIASDRRLAQAIMSNWTKVRGLGAAEARLREALIRIRIEAVMRELAVLEENELDQLVAQAMAVSAAETSEDIVETGGQQ